MMSSRRLPDRYRPEQQKYLSWFKEAKEEGLVSVSVTSEKALAKFLGEEYTKNISSEDIYKELNEINDALARGDFETVAHFDVKGNSLI